jgi:hypothetical protein
MIKSLKRRFNVAFRSMERTEQCRRAEPAGRLRKYFNTTAEGTQKQFGLSTTFPCSNNASHDLSLTFDPFFIPSEPPRRSSASNRGNLTGMYLFDILAQKGS